MARSGGRWKHANPCPGTGGPDPGPIPGEQGAEHGLGREGRLVSQLRITVESWDPTYGSPILDPATEPSDVAVDVAVELPPADWRPLRAAPGTAPARRVIFVDGVRRIDALVWIGEPGEAARRGICASFAAGIVEASERARVERLRVRRGLFSAVGPDPLATRAGMFEPMAVVGDDLEQLSLGLQQRLGELEIEVATSLESEADLIVVDGPLSGRQQVPGAVGYVKTHRVAYLPESLSPVVGRLAPGERTPLFLGTTSWTRYSWYLRLPGPVSHPWSGIVRLEATGNLRVSEASQLADLSAATLPAYASVPHKDPRAPQNLFPIAGLERELRHRLGDPAFVQRALRLAAAHPESDRRLAR